MNLKNPKKFFVIALVLVFALVILSGCGMPEPEDSELGTEMEEPQTEEEPNTQEQDEIGEHNDVNSQTEEGGF